MASFEDDDDGGFSLKGPGSSKPSVLGNLFSSETKRQEVGNQVRLSLLTGTPL